MSIPDNLNFNAEEYKARLLTFYHTEIPLGNRYKTKAKLRIGRYIGEKALEFFDFIEKEIDLVKSVRNDEFKYIGELWHHCKEVESYQAYTRVVR